MRDVRRTATSIADGRCDLRLAELVLASPRHIEVSHSRWGGPVADLVRGTGLNRHGLLARPARAREFVDLLINYSHRATPWLFTFGKGS
jgi:hypothetical protein